MNNVQISTMAALRAAGLNGNFVIHDLLSGQTIEFRGAAGNNNHIDVMYRTQNAFRNMLRMLGLPATRDHGNWRARPGVLEFTNNRGTFRFAVAYHTYNHSVRVAGQPFYNPVGFTVIRGSGAIPHERTAAGAWRPGEHICIWTGDSWTLRGSRTSAWEIEMRNAVRDAEDRCAATSAPPQSMTVNYQAEVRVMSKLNVRTGPGTNFPLNGFLRNGERVTIIRESRGPGANLWGQMPNGDWIALDHVRRLDTPSASLPTVQRPVPPNQKKWRVQIAASGNRDAIEREVNRLIKAQQYAYLNIYNGFYRAQVGVFATREEADRLAIELKLLGLAQDTFVKQG